MRLCPDTQLLAISPQAEFLAQIAFKHANKLLAGLSGGTSATAMHALNGFGSEGILFYELSD
jgi:hypothetical protein